LTSVSKFLFGLDEPNDRLRSAERVHRKPVVVWNVTPACNLACAHCYAASSSGQTLPDDVLDGAQARSVIDDLAAWNVPVLLFSGGEAFCRPDIR
jgi:MoaA/NifB/PqqE/SkfB family radical SAM enzyme